MKPNRTAIPKAVRDAVMNEFNHLCSICGEHSPQLHHIDENRENHAPLNLLPLCPNHHLTDQHNPTSKIDPGILALFRQYKDPTILTPQFQPLYKRLLFLDQRPSAGEDPRNYVCHINNCAYDLLRFVSVLEMGGFYEGELLNHLARAGFTGSADSPGPRLLTIEEKRASARTNVYSVIMEMIRFQPWRVEHQRT